MIATAPAALSPSRTRTEVWFRRILILFSIVAVLGLACNLGILLWAENGFSGPESVVASQAIMLAHDATLYYDLNHLLSYSDDVPVVFGTRTSQNFIWTGANMGRFLRWGNWAVAKMTELLFNTTILTDMGCTYRFFHQEALQLIRPHLTIGGSHFGPQLLMEVVAHHIPFVEIPVNYRTRVGESSVTGDLWKAFALGMRMIGLVLGYRFGLHHRSRTLWGQAFSVERRLAALSRSIANDSGALQGVEHEQLTPGAGPVNKT